MLKPMTQTEVAKMLKPMPKIEFDLLDFVTTPGAKWPKDMPWQEQLEKLRTIPFLTDKLRSLRYGDFLMTPYWDTVEKFLLSRMPNECAICCHTDRGLNLFRRSAYGYGREYLHHDYHDFLGVCDRCYGSLFHYCNHVTEETVNEIKEIIKNYQDQE